MAQNPPRSRRCYSRKQIIDEKFKLPFDYGWKREFVIRSMKKNKNAVLSSSRLGDVYYYSPNNQRLRSLREIQAQLNLINDENPLTIDCFTLLNRPLGINDKSKEIVRMANSKISKHPAPLPAVPNQLSCSSWKRLPPSPILTISKDEIINGFTLEWNMRLDNSIADITSFQIFYYCANDRRSSIKLWTEYCKVVSLPLPISMKIYQLERGLKYYFTIRAIDDHFRVGPFCTPGIVYLE